ncbi:cholesterol 24-hydroxylase-like [Corticium candelabrum]|uniref:cholesterol 24-hydroxylase-like n=1 Tax=Corticium candelabrum TaxID=121492 RepID=UPI002E26BFDC|nr:cholesterol 24-hydroxylase-like [Corticium candelabrum]
MVVFTIIAVIVATLIAAIGVLALLLANKRRRCSHLPGPPLASFWLGHVPILEEKRKEGVFHEDMLLEFTKKYGHVFVLWFIHIYLVHVSDPTGARQIVRDRTALKPPFLFLPARFPFGNRFLGCMQESLNDLDKWTRRHKITTPFYSNKNLRDSLAEPFNQIIDKFITYIDRAAEKGEIVRMKETLPLLTSGIMCSVSMGTELSMEEMIPINIALHKVLVGVLEQITNPLCVYLPMRDIRKMVKENCQFLRDLFSKWIEKRQKAIGEGEEHRSDVLGRMLEATATNGEYTLDEIIDTGLEYCLASHKAPSLTLCFALKEIVSHPEVKRRVVEEVDRVLEGKQFVSPADLPFLPYLTCVFKETTRRHPSVTAMNRALTSDFTVNGLVIPADTWVTVSVYCLHLSDDHWPDPLKFDPDRFASLATDESNMPFLGFGSGLRSCIGRSFSEQALRMALARIFQTFTIELEEDSRKCNKYADYKDGVLLLTPADPIKCKVKRRPEK